MSKISFNLTFITTTVRDEQFRSRGYRVICAPGKIRKSDADVILKQYPLPCDGWSECVETVQTVRRLAELDDSVVAELCHDVTGDSLGLVEGFGYSNVKEENGDE